MFETAPDEAGSGSFHLDDILVTHSDGQYGLYQVKHREASTPPWTWEDLLRDSESSPSLLKKWSQSIARPELRDKVRVAALLTNGPADASVTNFLREAKIDLNAIRGDADLWARLVSQFDSEAHAETFFGLFAFRFAEPSLDALEQDTRGKLHTVLHATQEGILSLCDRVAQECRSKHASPLDVWTLREWCQFDHPRPLREEFPVPDDFQYFDTAVHEALLNDLKSPDGGVKVLVGKPGTGKSVYLSKLHATLTDDNVFAPRHHYHISPSDANPQERLVTERVVEALKAQFKGKPEFIGDLDHGNSSDIPIREFINATASKHHAEGKAFVLIIDGLDHVVRKRDVDELREFLAEVCFPQPGLWIVLGTQRSVTPYLPAAVLDKAPEEAWLELPGLSRDATYAVVRQNLAGLHLPDDEHALSSLLNSIYDVTRGNPLHLRYALRALKAENGEQLITEYVVGHLVPYDNDIENYYRSLWGTLSDQAKTTLFTLASVNFVFTHQQLLECVSSFVTDPAAVPLAFRSVQHLIKEDNRQRLSAFHNSFQVFLLSQPEFEQQKLVLKRRMQDWLQQSFYETLKWAELRKVEYELGDAAPLTAIDRQWLIQALCHPRNGYQISEQLRLATEASFLDGDLTKAHLFSQLRAYYASSIDGTDDAFNLVMSEAFMLNPTSVHDIEPEYVPDQPLLTLMDVAHTSGLAAIVEEAHDVLIERQHDEDRATGTREAFRGALVEALAFDSGLEVERLYNYIKQFTESDLSADLFEVYVQRSLRNGAVSRIQELVGDHDFTPPEREVIASVCARYDALRLGDEPVFDHTGTQIPLVILYATLREPHERDLPPLPEHDALPTSMEDFHKEAVDQWRRLCLDAFINAIVYGLKGQEGTVERWFGTASSSWSNKAIACLMRAGLAVSRTIREHREVNCETLFESLAALEPLNWPEDRDRWGLREGLTKAVRQALSELLVIKASLGDVRAIETSSIEAIVATPFLTRSNLLAILVQDETPTLSPAAAAAFSAELEERLHNSVDYFSVRASTYARLASLARIHGDTVRASSLLERAADNLITYGYHKDMYLHGVIESIDHCAKAGTSPDKVQGWIKRIAPIVESIGDYTDGDETSSFRYDLANLRGNHDRPTLFREYFSKAEHQRFFRAQDLFQYVIRSLSFVDSTDVGLGTTALDRSSFAELTERATSSAGAAKAVSTIVDYLGTFPPEPKDAPSDYVEDELPDVAQTTPSQLGAFLAGGALTTWSRDRYLGGWAGYWTTHGDKREVYQALEALIGERELRYVSAGLLDATYPLALEFNPERSFELLCWAQAVDYGWQMYWTDRAKAERRWAFLKEKFPNRYKEFFTKSIEFASWSEANKRYFVPISRGVEFFVLFGDRIVAEEITDAAVAFSESLMADMQLPHPLWETPAYAERAIDAFDLLIQRLLWPSPLVRERAAVALADRIGSDRACRSRYLSWLAQQTMESVTAIGLVPLIRASWHAQENPLILTEVVASVRVGSIIIRELINELALALDVADDEIALPPETGIPDLPPDYVPDEFFQRNIRGFLAPIYSSWAEDLGRRGDFVRHWAFVADQLITQLGVERSNRPGYFHGDRGDLTIPGMSTMLSEIYRSAFLRVLQRFHADANVSDDFYLKYAFATLPVDLSMWRILPTRAPAWWPALAPGDQAHTDLVQLRLVQPIERIRDQDEFTVLAAEGAVRPPAGWGTENCNYSFSLIGFAYAVKGPNLPTAQQVADTLLDRPATAHLIPSSAARPLSFLENDPMFYTVNDEPAEIGDLAVFPMVGRVVDLTISLWQFFRDYNSFFMLTPAVRDVMGIKIANDGLIYVQGDDELARVSDFLEGLTERTDSDLPLPHGQSLVVAKSFLDPFLRSHSLRLGYLLTTRYANRPHMRGELESFTQHELIDVHGLILPGQAR